MTVKNRTRGGLETSQCLSGRVTPGLALMAGLAMLLTGACAPGAQGLRPAEGVGAPSVSKLLRVGITFDAEPRGTDLAFNNSAGGGEPSFMLHAAPTIFDERGNVRPHLAERIPSLADGDWKILPDGKMELTWKLRPGIRYHDGTPLDAADVVLAYKVRIHPEFGAVRGALSVISEVTSADPETFVVTWRRIDIRAEDMRGLAPLPRHKVQALYDAGDLASFEANPFWRDEWVGLGPYKMSAWEPGSHMEVVANDDYFLGRPKIDRILVRYYGDTRALLTAMIANDIDLIPVGSMKTEEGHVLKTQWEAPGNGKVLLSHNKLRNGDFQFRNPDAPWMDPRARMAMTLLLDRKAMVETLHNSLSDVDDIFFMRDHPAYQLARQKGVPNLTHDVSRARQLLDQAGFTRGGDGILRSAAGVPFRLELSATTDIQTNVAELNVVSDAWKRAGIESEHVLITAAMDKDAIRGQLKGVVLTSTTVGYSSLDGYETSQIRSQATRWRGSNVGGYSEPAYDDIYKRVFSTINASERDPIAADMVRMLLENMVYIPLTYSADVSAYSNLVRGITSVPPAQRVNAWNVHLWEIG